MADPTKYKPHFNYSGWEAAGSKRPKPGASLDTDFADIARSIDETIDALKDIRRSDGKLKNGLVDMDAMEPGLKADFQGYKDDAETARDQAQQARNEAQSAQSAAEDARDDAQTARTVAVNARNAAQTARSGAESARDDAQDANTAAQGAREGAEQARDAAEQAKTDAQSARSGAETARDFARDARDEAQAARDTSVQAKDTAVSARDRAETARDIAEGFASDIVSQGNVPIYASAATVQGLEIPAGITAFRTNGETTPGDGKGSLYVESDASSGTLQSGDGRWWAEAAVRDHGTFSTVADVENSHIPPVLDSIRTNGYYAPGDGGGVPYKRVASEPSHNSKVQSADGSWWEPVVPDGYTFDSVSDMQASKLVKPGARVRTLGYYTPGDGGGNDYEIVAAGTGTDDGGTFIDLPGSGLQAKGLQGIEVNVLHYGAGKPDGSDCSSNIQSAVNRLKSLHQQGTTAKIVFPPFTYNIESPIDMTGIRSLFKEWYVDARGAVFRIKTTGSVGFDLFGSRKCIWTGGVLIGDDVNTPSIGIQIGRDATGRPADVHVFNDLSIAGKFTLCCLYNNASEGTGFINVSLGNDNDSLQSYCLVQDGTTYWDVPSQFVATPPQGTPHSFNENYFINLDARKGVSGSAVWMSKTSRHKYYSSYVVTYDDAGFVVDAAHPTKGLHLDCHVETAAGGGAPKHYIRFESDAVVSSALCQDLMIQENSLHTKSLLGRKNVNNVVLENASISVMNIHGQVVDPSFIDGNIGAWTIYGSLHLCSGLYPNSRFVGRVFDHNPASDISFAGSSNEVVHTNMDDGTTQHLGGVSIAKRANGRCFLLFTEPATGEGLGQLQYNTTNESFLLSTSQSGEILYIPQSGVYPGLGRDGLMSLGSSGRRWAQVYAVDGNINTSDAREKTPLRPLTEAERNVAVRLSRLPGVYQWLSALAQKGEEGARLHVGVTAQDVKAAFEAEGLDGFRYGVLCWDEWDAEEAEFDEDGNVLTPPREAGDRYGVRYDELAQWQAAGWNARLEALEISGD